MIDASESPKVQWSKLSLNLPLSLSFSWSDHVSSSRGSFRLMIFNLLGAVQRPKLSQHSADFHFNSIPSHQAEKCEQGQSLFEGSLKMDEYQEKLRKEHLSATEATR